jgi:type I restriction enzyme, S subunit
MRRLGDLAEHVRESTTPTPDDSRRYVGLEHLNTGDSRICSWASASSARSSKFVFRTGDVLYGKLRPYLDKAALAEFDGVASTDLLVLRPRNDIDADFLAYTMHSQPVLDHAIATTAGVNHPRTSWSALSAMEVYAPPLNEQRRIVRILQPFRELHTATESKESALRRTKASVVESLFGDVVMESSSLEEVASIERGRFTHRPRNDPRFYGGDTPFIQTGDVTSAAMTDGFIHSHSQTLNERGLEVSRCFPAGTIAITIAANIGYVARLTYPAAFPDSVIAITPNEKIDGAYLSHYLATQQGEIDRRAPRGTQKNINIEFLKPWPVPVPARTDQQQIAHAIDALDRAVSSTHVALESVKGAFRSALFEFIGNAS